MYGLAQIITCSYDAAFEASIQRCLRYPSTPTSRTRPFPYLPLPLSCAAASFYLLAASAFVGGWRVCRGGGVQFDTILVAAKPAPEIQKGGSIVGLDPPALNDAV